MRYRRVVVKLSGAALAGEDSFGLSSAARGHVGRELLALAEGGVQVAVVVGGGNFFRGSLAEEWGVARAEADPSASILARDHGLPLHVFDADAAGAPAAIARGEAVGTRIAMDAQTAAAPR